MCNVTKPSLPNMFNNPHNKLFTIYTGSIIDNSDIARNSRKSSHVSGEIFMHASELGK